MHQEVMQGCTIAAQLQWVTTATAPWTAGWQHDCDGRQWWRWATAGVMKRDGDSSGKLHSTMVAAQLAAGRQHNRDGWMAGWLRNCDADG